MGLGGDPLGPAEAERLVPLGGGTGAEGEHQRQRAHGHPRDPPGTTATHVPASRRRPAVTAPHPGAPGQPETTRHTGSQPAGGARVDPATRPDSPDAGPPGTDWPTWAIRTGSPAAGPRPDSPAAGPRRGRDPSRTPPLPVVFATGSGSRGPQHPPEPARHHRQPTAHRHHRAAARVAAPPSNPALRRIRPGRALAGTPGPAGMIAGSELRRRPVARATAAVGAAPRRPPAARDLDSHQRPGPRQPPAARTPTATSGPDPDSHQRPGPRQPPAARTPTATSGPDPDSHQRPGPRQPPAGGPIAAGHDGARWSGPTAAGGGLDRGGVGVGGGGGRRR